MPPQTPAPPGKEMPASRERLLERVAAAFRDVPVPPAVSDGCPRPSCRDLERRFRGRERATLTTEEVQILAAEFAVLNEAAARYFAPVLLAASVEASLGPAFDLFVQNFFQYPGLHDPGGYQARRAAVFRPGEAAVIGDVVAWWLAHAVPARGWRPELERSLPFWREQGKQAR